MEAHASPASTRAGTDSQLKFTFCHFDLISIFVQPLLCFRKFQIYINKTDIN